ncbi:HD domain-containing protein [Undibacterium luofuense]|uniref:HD domain-containing protein n=1 Tax=Undibacterium luofuense TaxID=2828733 RepID=UPI002E2EE08E|nr:ATP-binding protein [Undibacterium luofuense]
MGEKMRVIEQTGLWKRSLGNVTGENATEVNRLVETFKRFRNHVEQLISFAKDQLPGLTIHDISHLDALWRVADQIAGDQYPLNPLEAFVFGGAVLLHDAAHVVQAYPDGVDGLRQKIIWKDIVAQNYGGVEPAPGTNEFKQVFFSVARHLHAEQAMNLLDIEWSGRKLLEDFDLRNSVGVLIGKIAASHHWSMVRVQQEFCGRRRIKSPPTGFPIGWKVDALKLACLLRSADAAHIDSERAPSFLMAVMQPKGVSAHHWSFQNKLNQPTRDDRTALLRIDSMWPFNEKERDSWWLAFDTAKMIDLELRQVKVLMREEGCSEFAVNGVAGIESAKNFSEIVEVEGWEPVDVKPRIGNVARIIETLGGRALYGDRPEKAIYELLQNAFDAIRAARCLGYLKNNEGRVEVSIEKIEGGKFKFTVSDDGIGMSRYVLTEVLLDFGESLWRSDDIYTELPNLRSSSFEPIGKFGIGFFSVFMLSDQVLVTTKKYPVGSEEINEQLELHFENGLHSRPVLRVQKNSEKFIRNGTKVELILDVEKVDQLLKNILFKGSELYWKQLKQSKEIGSLFAKAIASICPTADINIYFCYDNSEIKLVEANDWWHLDDEKLCERLGLKARKLTPISKNNKIVGRVDAFPKSGLYCSVTVQGIAYARMAGAIGVICADNNSLVASRNEIVIEKDSFDWRGWAVAKLEATDEMSSEELCIIKSVLPEKNLAIWDSSLGLIDDSSLLSVANRNGKIKVICSGGIEFKRISTRLNSYWEREDDLVFVSDAIDCQELNPEWDWRLFLMNLLNKSGGSWTIKDDWISLSSSKVKSISEIKCECFTFMKT